MMKTISRLFSIFIVASLLAGLALSAQPVPSAAAASTWVQVGAAGFSTGAAYKISLAFDNGGTPYVAYKDGGNSDKASVMKFNGSSWEQVGAAGFSSGWVDHISLAFDNGTPYVAYMDGANGNKASVMKFNGSSWEQVGAAGFSAGMPIYISLAFDNSTPYIAYADGGNGNKASVMKFNAVSGNWVLVGAAGFSVASYTSLAIYNGTPYVAYMDDGNGDKASVMKFNGTAWEQVGAAGFSAGIAQYTSLAFDNGTPYVAYMDGANDDKASLMKFNGTAWGQVGAAGFSAGSASNTSLAFDSHTPYVAYKDSVNDYKASVMKFNGSSWEQVGTAGFSAGAANYISLAFDNGGTPYVAYSDITNDYKASVMKYASAAPTLGVYSAAAVALSGDTTVTPDAGPTDTMSIYVSTSPDFNGAFVADPSTGVVTVTNAHPAGTYTVTVKAFGVGGSTTTTFALTVNSGTACTGMPVFTSAADTSVGTYPESVAVGDFNKDGNQDFATANFFADTVSIRLGDGDGGFSGSTEVGVSYRPDSVAIGDFNKDGNQDFAAANFLADTVSIRLGDGSGGFSGATEVGVGYGPYSVAIGDFNKDGNQDFATANYYAGNVSIRLGDGSGEFSGSTEVGVGYGPYSVVVGDFNKDGNQDFATANSGTDTVSIRLGDGDGGFDGSTEVGVGADPYSVAVGDFNKDGNQDFATANNGENTVSIRLGDGSGGFSGATEVGVGTWPYSVAVGDFNKDGNQDFAATNRDSNTVSIRLGDGSGEFSGAPEVGVGYGPYSIVIGDFNKDGNQDFATANLADSVSIRLGGCGYTVTFDGNGGGTPSPTSKLVTFGSAYGTLATVSRAGYTFNDWYTAASGGDLIIDTSIVSTASDHNLYAHWTINPYTLTVNSAHGTVTKSPDQATYHYGDVVTLNVTPEAGWTFSGWTPSLTGNQVTIIGNTIVTANYRQIPVITWANPASISYGTPLGATQLNATANTTGTFTYDPDAGAILNAGTHTLHVDFVPDDTLTYTDASKDVSITITQAASVLTWAAPASISYGTPLGATQLNASADTTGVFTYTPDTGEILDVGAHTLHVDFVPADAVNYTNASKDVSITVLEATAPLVVSITRVDPSPTELDSLHFTVTFSESVTDVDEGDFILTATGKIDGEAIINVDGNEDTYTVTVSRGTGGGTLRLDVPASATITDQVGNPLTTPYESGEAYTILFKLYLPLYAHDTNVFLAPYKGPNP
jgi:uncharacterized repeat protein (TIGR02543 family)